MTLEISKRNDLFYDPFTERMSEMDKNRNRHQDRKFSSDRSSGSYNDDDCNDDRKSSQSDNCEYSDDTEHDNFHGMAPPIDILDRIKGYEMVSFETISVPPPIEVDEQDSKGQEDVNGDENSQPVFDILGVINLLETPIELHFEDGEEEKKPKQDKTVYLVQEIGSKLTEQQARAALLTHISNQCCYGRGAAKNMTIESMDYLAAYHYELQTFTEKRETTWTYAPLRSGYEAILGTHSSSGLSPPLPWEIEEAPSHSFKEEVRLIEVPHTESTKTCHRCKGTGGVVCRDCNGKGWVRCLHCHGNGWMHDSSGHKERCFYCQHSRNGHGQQDCHKCHSKGKVNCQTCEGHGQIRCFIQLSITWKVHTADHIVERLDLPSDLIRDASGQVAFEEEGCRVKAVDLDIAFSSNSPDGTENRSLLIKEASSNIVAKHLTAFSLDQKVIRQRHQVRIVPVTRITYEWKLKPHVFYVYGYENKVHLPKYPQNCCWGCQIS